MTGGSSKGLRWAYYAAITLAFLPISLSGLLYFVDSEGTARLRWALTALSAIGWIVLTFVERAAKREPGPEMTELSGPVAGTTTRPRP